jgi:RNA polymerase sigma-70 factor, ECF subfamily
MFVYAKDMQRTIDRKGLERIAGAKVLRSVSDNYEYGHRASAAAPDNSMRDAMLATVPSLRAFAISLCRNVDRADDLVQETLLRALANFDSFRPGTNMAAWLFAILRNQFHSECRKRRREVEDADGSYAKTLKSHAEQDGHVEFEELRVALAKLPSDQREALLLVGASGFSYEEAAQICGARSAPSRAGSIGQERDWPRSCRSKALTTSALTVQRGRSLPATATTP